MLKGPHVQAYCSISFRALLLARSYCYPQVVQLTYCYNIPIYDWNTSLESIWVITYGSASASAWCVSKIKLTVFKSKYCYSSLFALQT